MIVLYVASDQEGVGKTATCAALARKLRQQGRSVAIFKPLAGSGVGPDSDADVYQRLLNQKVDVSPFDAVEGRLGAGLLNRVKSAFGPVAKGMDVVLVEGSCGLSVEQSSQLVEALDARALVVVRHRRELSASDLKPWQGQLGERLAGFVVNGLPRYLGTETRTKLLPSLDAEGLRCFGVIPEDRLLLGVSVRQLAEHLRGRFIVCEEKADALVAHFLVGGWTLDEGRLYFGLREDKAAIIRGDRPDMQMAALATPTACLVCTCGIEPIEYVRYEAEQEEVSVLVVEADTLAAMSALNTLMDSARFDHPRKLSRFGELLEQHVDMAALFREMGL
jgi:hypothetical protein